MIKKTILMLLVLVGGVMSANADDVWTLRGDFNEWGSNYSFNSDNKVTVTFSAGQTILFKVVKNNDIWYGCSNHVTYSQNQNLEFSNSGDNCYMIAGESGEYTFSLDTSGNNPKLSVTYPEYTGTIYFCNNLGWEAPIVYILTTDYWDNSSGSGSNGRPKGIEMQQIDNSNIWKASCPSNITVDGFYIAFLDKKQDDYNNFWQAKAVYRGDYMTNKPLFVPDINSTGTYNSTEYFNNGEWHAYPTYTRSVTSGNLGTICLPFDATIDGATAYKIVSKTTDGETLTGLYIDPVESLEAGKPYIFKVTGTTLTATYSGSFTDATPAFGMSGNLSATAVNVDPGNYIIKDNKIRKVAGGTVTIGQYRAYITLNGIAEATSTSSSPYFIGIDGATGIEGLEIENRQDAVYNLQGQRVTNIQKGMYIINGKKVLVK